MSVNTHNASGSLKIKDITSAIHFFSTFEAGKIYTRKYFGKENETSIVA